MNARMLSISILFAAHSSAGAAITVFNTYEEWAASAGEFTTIGFADLAPPPPGEFLQITDQYAGLGMTIPDDDYALLHYNRSNFIDDWGVKNHNDDSDMWFEFSEPIHTFSARMANSGFHWWLYDGDELVHFIPQWITDFRGFISDEPFDRVRVMPGLGSIITMDDIMFQTIIPAPGVLTALAGAGLLNRGSRKRHA